MRLRFSGQQLVVNRGSCLLRLFGTPFFGIGVFVMMASLSEDFGSGGEQASWLAPFSFGLLFGAVGFAFMTWRGGSVIDRSMQTATSWWGLVFPWSRKSGSYRQSRHLALRREVRRSKNSTYTVYPVRLQAEGLVVDIDAPRSYEIARRRAEEVAKFLDLGVEDTSTGQSVVREAGKLDASLRDLAASEARQQALQPMPAGCRIKMQRLEDGVVFELPPPKATLPAKAAKALGVGMLIISAATAPFVLFALGDGIDEALGPLLFSVFWMVAALAVFRSARARGTGVENVFASPQRLALETPSFAGKRRSSIPADELEELVLVGGDEALARPMAAAAAAAKVSGGGASPDGAGGEAAPGIPAGIGAMLAAAGLVPSRTIVARSDAVTLQFGAGLDNQEIEWLHEMLRQILTR